MSYPITKLIDLRTNLSTSYILEMEKPQTDRDIEFLINIKKKIEYLDILIEEITNIYESGVKLIDESYPNNNG